MKLIKALRISIVAFVIVGLAACAWWQKHSSQINCAAITTVENAPQLLTIVTACTEIATTPAAIIPCIESAAGSKWAGDVIACFSGSVAGLTRCPAAEAVAPKMLSSTNSQNRLREAVQQANYQFAP